MKKIYTNCIIYTGDEVLENTAVVTQNEKTEAVLPESELPPCADTEIIDLGGRILAPAFIDLQINGGGGVLFNDAPTSDSLRTIAKAHEKFGVLNFCPTIVSADIETILKGIGAVKQAKAENLGIIGAHIEGPFIDLEKSGIHDKSVIRKAADDELKRIISEAEGCVTYMTVSPNAVTFEQINMLREAGIRVFIGHSNASCEQALEAFERGVSGVTHLFNAMSGFGSREPGVVGAAFLRDDIYAGIIADGFHADYNSVIVAKKIKKDKLFLVSDAVSPVGSDKPMKFKIGGGEIFCVNGKCVNADGVLAGAALDMATAVRNCVNHCKIPLDEALRMAALYPAKAIGLQRLGAIKPEFLADFAVLNEQLYVEAIVRRGEHIIIN
jgi:N-acetylglucosamine-6-phosphate deacetylase